MESLKEILNTFLPVTLEELDIVRLLDRIDTKYIFNTEKLSELLDQLKMRYRILDVNGIRLNCYQTLYFDTPSLTMYLHHHNKKLNRYKVRLRRYCDSDLNFFEVKFKTNKGRTIKSRVKRTLFSTEIEGESLKLLTDKTPFSPKELNPVLRVNYSRMTFTNQDMTERITIDTGVSFNHDGQEKSFPWLVIAEIKQANSGRSEFNRMMHENGIPEMAISKYCLGIMSIYDNIRKNNFKSKMLQINKLNHDVH